MFRLDFVMRCSSGVPDVDWLLSSKWTSHSLWKYSSCMKVKSVNIFTEVLGKSINIFWANPQKESFRISEYTLNILNSDFSSFLLF